jgi:hypothetical protein
MISCNCFRIEKSAHLVEIREDDHVPETQIGINPQAS